MSDDREQKVRERAHALWEADGRSDGRHEEHWKQAETDIDGPSGSAPTQESPAEGDLDIGADQPHDGVTGRAGSAPTQEKSAEGDEDAQASGGIS